MRGDENWEHTELPAGGSLGLAGDHYQQQWGEECGDTRLQVGIIIYQAGVSTIGTGRNTFRPYENRAGQNLFIHKENSRCCVVPAIPCTTQPCIYSLCNGGRVGLGNTPVGRDVEVHRGIIELAGRSQAGGYRFQLA